MFRLLLATASIAVAATLAGAASGSQQSPIVPDLNASVTARTISLTDKSGKRIEILYPNTYRITVKDSTKAQNFHLVGPGVNLRTKVVATTKTTWRVHLNPGRYVYRSDRSSKLRGTFTVRGAPPA